MDNQCQPKGSRSDLYNKMMKDFSEAASVFDESTYMDKPGRFTKSACLAFMAKVAMFNGFSDINGLPNGIPDLKSMENVVSYCEQIQGYKLDEDIRTAFIESKQINSTEMIFSARYGAPDFSNSANTIYCAWSSTMVQRNLVDAFECIDGLPWGISPLTVNVDESLINSTNAEASLIAAERSEERRVGKECRL